MMDRRHGNPPWYYQANGRDKHGRGGQVVNISTVSLLQFTVAKSDLHSVVFRQISVISYLINCIPGYRLHFVDLSSWNMV